MKRGLQQYLQKFKDNYCSENALDKHCFWWQWHVISVRPNKARKMIHCHSDFPQSFSITFSWNSINHELCLWLSLGIVWNIQHRYRSSATLIQLMQMSFATFILLHLSSYCCPPNIKLYKYIPCIFHYNFIKRDFPLNISQLFLVLARSTVRLLPNKGPNILSQGYYMFINCPQEFPNASNLTMLYYFQMLNTSHLG